MKKINLALIATAMAPALAFAQEGTTAVATTAGVGANFWAAGLCMGLAASVIGFSQSRAAVAALEGIGRNPASSKNSFVPLILSLALMEALALFAFLVANKLIG
jgi:F-type H+-transporting ATPase subunit c